MDRRYEIIYTQVSTADTVNVGATQTHSHERHGQEVADKQGVTSAPGWVPLVKEVET